MSYTPASVHENTCPCESSFGVHVLRNAGSGMEGDRFPNEVRFESGRAAAHLRIVVRSRYQELRGRL